MNDRQWELITGQKINRARERRQHAAERAALIAALGWAPEPANGERYCATTAELQDSVRRVFGEFAARILENCRKHAAGVQ